jgi:ribosomal protein S18 acetylase RimI-like enzyme
MGKGITGYAVAVRIPKLDARMGFLFVDELYVLPSYRRRGVARRMISHVQSLAREEGLAGVRLLVRPENGPARALYRGCAFQEQESFFCQWCSAPAGPLGRPATRGESAR